MLSLSLRLIIDIIYEMVRNLAGTIVHPYLTWKRLKSSRLSSAFLALIIFTSYFAWREPIRWGNITQSGITIEQLSTTGLIIWLKIAILRWLISLLTFGLIVCLISVIGELLKNRFRTTLKSLTSSLHQTMIAWSYSYLPTILWFTMTASAFAVLPPPRHETWLGLIFSIIFLTVSFSLLIWKGLLYYLTLRLTIGLNAKQILLLTLILIPVLAIYIRAVFILELVKVPFI